MTVVPVGVLDPAVPVQGSSPRGGVRRLGRLLRRDPLALVGLVLVVLLVLAALLGPWIAPYPDQGRGVTDVASRVRAPSAEHWLGTDQLGRDVLSRIVFGARGALLVPVFVVGLAVLIGVPLGAVAGYRGGRLDELLMRLTDVFLAFPPLLLAMVTVALLGPSLLNAGIALAIAWWPWYARLVRGVAQSLRDRPFVEAARAMGVPQRRILSRHIVRNAVTPIMVQGAVDMGTVILAAGSLAFLGLGAQPPEPDWGLMVAEGRATLMSSWWISTFPGLAIFLAVLGFNVLGDLLRDVLDPRGTR